jgi:DNA-directed RNA polymerase subunit P
MRRNNTRNHYGTTMAGAAKTGESGKAFGSIVYECERCGTKQTLEELSRFPEIRCKNCGYRALKKVRPPIPKRIKHAV